jgi:two-component system chemotaxis response regulator CheY
MYDVLDIGNCPADHRSIRTFLEARFPARVWQADTWGDAQGLLAEHPMRLVLVNRVLDADGSEGLDVIRLLKASPWAQVPVMLVTNFDAYQRQAVELGASPGFGKSSLGRPQTVDRVRDALGPQGST